MLPKSIPLTIIKSLESRNAQNHRGGGGDDDDDMAGIYTTLQSAARTLSTEDNPLFEQTQQLLRLSRAMLDCHRTAERACRGGPQLALASPGEAWKRDEEGMRRLLEYGRLYAERIVEGWITPGEKEGADEQEEVEEEEGEEDAVGEGRGREREREGSWDTEMMNEAERLARGMFEKSQAGLKGEETWGLAARKQMMAFAGLVRALPGRKAME